MEYKNILIIGFIVGILVGFVGGRFYSSGDASISSARVVELEQKIENTKKLFPPVVNIRSVSGITEMIQGNTLVIKTSSSSNPFEELAGKIEVVVTNSTKIIRLTQKDQEEFQKEIELSQKQRRSGDLFLPSMPFTEKEILLMDIKVGDHVLVEAGESIKGKTKFEAIRIAVQETSGFASSTFSTSSPSAILE